MMLTLSDAMNLTGLPYSTLRRFCLEGKIAYVRSGSKYYLNKESLLSFLKGDSHESGDASAK